MTRVKGSAQSPVITPRYQAGLDGYSRIQSILLIRPSDKR
jgi:hypothetical protein